MKEVLTIILTLFSLALTAQTVSVSEGVSIRNDKAYHVIGNMKGKTLLFRDRSNYSFEVQAFDERLRLSWKKELELEKKRPEILEVINGKDNFSIVYKYRVKGKQVVKIHRYGPSANLIDSITVKKYGSRIYTPTPTVVYSEDKKSLLIYHIEKFELVEATSFNIEDMSVNWDMTFKPDNFNYHRNFQQILVNNSGQMFLVLNKDNRKAEKEYHRFEVYHARGKANVKKFEMHMEGYLTYDVSFTYDNLNKKIIAAGLYSERSRGKAIGYFYTNFNPITPNDKQIHFTPFDEEFIKSFMGKKGKKNVAITECSVQELVLRRDGGILLVGERNKIFERRMSSSGRGYAGRDGINYIVDHHYEDMFIISIHPDGRLHWKDVLHKRQYSQDDDAIFSSYFLMKTPSSLRVLFNDEIKFENTVSEYIVKANGQLDRNAVMSTDDQQIRLRFKDALQTRSNELLVPSEHTSKLKLIRITY